MSEPRPRLLLVACDGLEWSLVQRLVDDGGMPHLKRLLEAGTSGRLASVPPLRSAVLWASVATGCRPRLHGVTAATELRPDGGGVQPAGRRSWRAPAFWELMAAAGLTTGVVGWPATAPAGRWPGIVVDDSFAEPRGSAYDDWPLPPLCIAPLDLRQRLRDLRVHPSDIAGDDLEPFVPGFARIDQRADRRIYALAAMLAEAVTVHAAATQLAQDAACEVLVVRYRFVGAVQQHFLQYRPDAGRDPVEVARYGGVVDAAYRFQDMMLGRLLELCGAPADTVIASASGFSTQPGIDMSVGERPGPSASAWGMFAAAGPSFARDRLLHGATVFDICPTLLATCGLAGETAKDGRPLADAFAHPPPIGRPISCEASVDPPGVGAGAVEALRTLGYADAPTEAQQKAIDRTRVAGLVNAARAEMELGGYGEAAGLLREALRLDVGHAPAVPLLARCYVHLERWEACRPFAKALIARDRDAPWGHLLQGAVHAVAGDTAAAEPYLARARETGRAVPLAQLYLGLLALQLGDAAGAEDHFRQAIAQRAGYAEAMTALGIALLARGDLDGAESQLRQAIGLRFHQPLAHLHLGKLLAARGRLVDAAAALHIAVRQAPDHPMAQPALRQVERAILAGLRAEPSRSPR